MLFREGGKAWLRDLGSANGTTINGESIGARVVAVRPGDAVSFGPVSFTFRPKT